MRVYAQLQPIIMKQLFISTSFILLSVLIKAQSPVIAGKVFDAISKEPMQGAIIRDSRGSVTISDMQGRFSLATADSTLTVSFNSYRERQIHINHQHNLDIDLTPADKMLQEITVNSASRTAQKRSEAPIAIATISKQTMEDTRAQRIDQLLNKMSGVFMVSLGNEQHAMSIRQPMSMKSLFLYMEDGIPIRTTGVFNHNALLEMNLPAARSIEVIKGPSSALYGAEAIAGAVNIITQSSPAIAGGSVSTQLNDNGYKRVDAQAGTTMGQWGVMASGYYASRTNGQVDHSDFHKSAFTLRTDYKPNTRTTWSNSLSYIDYYSDMTGALDSIKFAQRNYSTPHTFTYRKVKALRAKSVLSHAWNANSESSLSLMYRNNSIQQNPSYAVGNTSNPLLFRGQVNENAFRTYALFAQHTQRFSWLNSKLVAGASIDRSPQTYAARFIWINKDTTLGKYTSYYFPATDSLLQDYRTDITNLAAYLDYEMSPFKNFKLVIALRYDAFRYDFNNHLDTAKTTVAVSTVNNYQRVTPKIGFTYNYRGIGFYGNYSEGYVPPQLTELYSGGSKVAPYLLPQTFHNYEVGGWLSALQNKLYADWSLYLMQGSNEIISVKLPDNTYLNQNAGKTRHIGIEYGIQYRPTTEWAIRFSATNAKHTYVENLVRGVNYNGKEMSSAPRFTCNGELSWKPAFVKGFRLSAEWQHQGRYFMDDLDNYTYGGFDVVNFRTGYTCKHIDIWVNLLNAFNTYYSTLAGKNATMKGNASYTYQLGDPRELTVGIGYRFGK
jgi:outer membrane receptor protein involved in Fe transport